MAEEGPTAPASSPTKTFTFHLPDGRTGSVNAPEGTSNDKAWGYLVQQHPEYGQQTGGGDKAADPPEDPALGYVEAFEQGAVLDPLEAAGQMAENLPGALGRWARSAGQAFSSTFPGVQKYLDESRAGAESHPITRMAGNVLPWLAVPGGGIAADLGLGAASGALQPTDTNDPNFWANKGLQAGSGGVLGGILGAVGRGISQSLQRAAQATKQYQRASGAAVSAQVAQDAAHDVATQAARDAHAQATADAAAQAAKVMADHHKAVSDQMGALHGHLGAVVGAANRNAEKMQQHAADSADHILNEARLQTDYAAKKAAFDADMAQRNALNQEQNLAWMRRALGKVGLADRTPTKAGDEALAATRQMIGGKLNEANAQLSLNPGAADLVGRLRGIGKRLTAGEGEGVLQGASDKQRFGELMRNRVLSPIGNLLRDDEGNVVGWTPKEELSGQQFANYVTMLNQEADNLARSARFPGRDTENQLKMAQALHDMVDVIEDSAEGPAAAKTLRDNAREGYKIYSTLSSAADPTKLSIAEPGAVVRQIQRRAGNATRYQNIVSDPASRGYEDAQHARSWLQQSMEPKPETPAAPKIPKPPKAPKLETQPSAPTTAMKDVKEPKLPKEPTLDLPKAPPKVAMPKPPTQAPPSRGRQVGEAAARAGAHFLGFQGGHMLGLPPGLANVGVHIADVARQARQGKPGVGSKAIRGLASRPGVVGKVPAVTFDILGVTPEEGSNGETR